MGIFRLLAISFLLSATGLHLQAQSQLLSKGCRYVRIPIVPNNPFARPVPYPESAFLKGEANLTRVVVPQQFRMHNLPARTEGFVSAKRFSFAEPKGDFEVLCGFH